MKIILILLKTKLMKNHINGFLSILIKYQINYDYENCHSRG
jgi:hypothetical protein